MEERRLRCPDCRESVCFKCREDWHGYCTSCESAFQSKVGYITHVTWCPVCRTKIERNGGCNHMTCYVCNHYFCYLCSSPVGSCVCDMFPVRNNCLRRMIIMIAFVVLIMAIPMALLLTTPIALTLFCFSDI
jgi:IBR domain, a half RING-finger domain